MKREIIAAGNELDRIIALVAKMYGKKPEDLVNVDDRCAEIVEYRRIVVYVACAVRKIQQCLPAKKFGYSEANIGVLFRDAKNKRYGKSGEENFTQAADTVSGAIEKEFGALSGTTPLKADKVPVVRRKYKRRKAVSKSKGKPAESSPTEVTSQDEVHGHIMYALFSVTPVTVDQLAHAFGVTSTQAEQMIGAAFISTKKYKAGLNAALDKLQTVAGLVKQK